MLLLRVTQGNISGQFKVNGSNSDFSTAKRPLDSLENIRKGYVSSQSVRIPNPSSADHNFITVEHVELSRNGTDTRGDNSKSISSNKRIKNEYLTN